jgi:hypothetical protein
MGCLGVHFSLSADEVDRLRAVPEQQRVDYVHETIEKDCFDNHRERLAESDKAWDAMHRTLADGQLSWDGGKYPLNHVVLGGERLYDGTDFIMVLKTPEQVRDVARVISSLDEAEFRRRYFSIDPDSYGFPMDDTDFGYTWNWFQEVRKLWMEAASEGRYVLFTADQ